MLNYRTVKFVAVRDFDNLISETYGKPYSFQQQDGCKARGVEKFNVPLAHPYDYENDCIPEVVNGEEMGVSFKAWLSRDPKLKLDTGNKWDRENGLNLFWERNFYPCMDMVVQDLYEKGLIEAGEYHINIDW